MLFYFTSERLFSTFIMMNLRKRKTMSKKKSLHARTNQNRKTWMSEVVKKSDNGNWSEYKLNKAWGAVKHMHNTCCLQFFFSFFGANVCNKVELIFIGFLKQGKWRFMDGKMRNCSAEIMWKYDGQLKSFENEVEN